jgi:hypothetical protein
VTPEFDACARSPVETDLIQTFNRCNEQSPDRFFHRSGAGSFGEREILFSSTKKMRC